MRKVKCFFELEYGDKFFANKTSYIKLDDCLWIGPKDGPKIACNALNAVDGTIVCFAEGLAVEIE